MNPMFACFQLLSVLKYPQLLSVLEYPRLEVEQVFVPTVGI